MSEDFSTMGLCRTILNGKMAEVLLPFSEQDRPRIRKKLIEMLKEGAKKK